MRVSALVCGAFWGTGTMGSTPEPSRQRIIYILLGFHQYSGEESSCEPTLCSNVAALKSLSRGLEVYGLRIQLSSIRVLMLA